MFAWKRETPERLVGLAGTGSKRILSKQHRTAGAALSLLVTTVNRTMCICQVGRGQSSEASEWPCECGGTLWDMVKLVTRSPTPNCTFTPPGFGHTDIEKDLGCRTEIVALARQTDAPILRFFNVYAGEFPPCEWVDGHPGGRTWMVSRRFGSAE